ncbi:MAG: putative beta-lactamase hcpC precursor [Pseudomonadota bacterium]
MQSEESLQKYLLEGKLGDADSQNKLGDIYRCGEGVEINLDTAVYWYNLAAGQDCAAAQYSLALMYRFGLGVNCSKEEALKLYESAIEQEKKRLN